VTQRGKFPDQIICGDLVYARDEGLGRFILNLGRCVTIRAQHAGARRHDNRPGA
jgi:hypothetical protein